VQGSEVKEVAHYEPEDGASENLQQGPRGKGHEGRGPHREEKEEGGADNGAVAPKGAEPGVGYAVHPAAVEHGRYRPADGSHQGEEVSEK